MYSPLAKPDALSNSYVVVRNDLSVRPDLQYLSVTTKVAPIPFYNDVCSKNSPVEGVNFTAAGTIFVAVKLGETEYCCLVKSILIFAVGLLMLPHVLLESLVRCSFTSLSHFCKKIFSFNNASIENKIVCSYIPYYCDCSYNFPREGFSLSATVAMFLVKKILYNRKGRKLNGLLLSVVSCVALPFVVLEYLFLSCTVIILQTYKKFVRREKIPFDISFLARPHCVLDSLMVSKKLDERLVCIYKNDIG